MMLMHMHAGIETWDEWHLFELAADVAERAVAATKRARHARGALTSPSAGVSSKGVEVIVTALQRDSARVANIVTLAGTREAIAALQAAALVIKDRLAVNARVIVERAHVTLLFTLTRDEEQALRVRAASLAHEA